MDAFQVAFVLLMLGFYLLPTILALGKKRGGAIFALNLLLGWTVIGWVGALVWALAEEEKEEGMHSVPIPTPDPLRSAPPAMPQRAPGTLPSYCLSCGRGVQSGDSFCRSCGKKLGESEVIEQKGT